MDARDTVTVEEGDRYPLGPPSYGDVAQLVEQQTENLCVTGSIPVIATKFGNVSYCQSQHRVERVLGVNTRWLSR